VTTGISSATLARGLVELREFLNLAIVWDLGSVLGKRPWNSEGLV
jgi:hypothetical protein